jgi:hypothetical protein
MNCDPMSKLFAPEFLYEATQIMGSRRLTDFVRAVDPKYRMLWFHRRIADALQDLEAGKMKKLMVFMPPQHGKSQLTTRLFPTWAIGRNPDLRIAVASYSATVARRFNRDIKRILKSEEYKEVFPDLELPQRYGSHANTADLIEIPNKQGSLYFVGRGGSLTSMSVDLGIIDDPLKDRKEAMSPVILESLWEWYVDVFSTRILDTGKQVLIQTRWDQNDLAGRLLAQDGYYSESNPGGWVVISFPALRTEEPNRYDPRKVGEALWPERKGVATLQKIKAKNLVTFNSLYQQDPKPSDDVLIFPDWQPIDEFPKNVETIIYGLDFGFTNDPTGIVKVGIDGGNLYLEEICYETDLTNPKIANLIKAGGLQDEIFVCDSSEPKSIVELQTLGINAMGAVKGAGSKNLGIDRLKEYTVFYVKSGVNLTREIKNYKWLVVAGKKTNTPQDGNDHLMDPTRYVIQTIIL